MHPRAYLCSAYSMYEGTKHYDIRPKKLYNLCVFGKRVFSLMYMCALNIIMQRPNLEKKSFHILRFKGC